MYDNQKIIDAENRKLKEVDPGWSVGSMCIVGNKVVAINVTVPLKGNAEKIRRLEAEGWRRTFRKKTRNDMFFESSGKMMQCMRKDIQEDW